MPEDLNIRKERINKTMDSLGQLNYEGVGISDLNDIKDSYKSLSDSIKSYTADCNARGIEKNNDESLNSIKEQLNYINSSISEIKKSLMIGSWIFSGSGVNYTRNIFEDHTYTGNGISGYYNGTWSGTSDYLSFTEEGFGVTTSSGKVSEDGNYLTIQTSVGELRLKRDD